jgi:hypothetical protein
MTIAWMERTTSSHRIYMRPGATSDRQHGTLSSLLQSERRRSAISPWVEYSGYIRAETTPRIDYAIAICIWAATWPLGPHDADEAREFAGKNLGFGGWGFEGIGNGERSSPIRRTGMHARNKPYGNGMLCPLLHVLYRILVVL